MLFFYLSFLLLAAFFPAFAAPLARLSDLPLVALALALLAFTA